MKGEFVKASELEYVKGLYIDWPLNPDYACYSCWP